MHRRVVFWTCSQQLLLVKQFQVRDMAGFIVYRSRSERELQTQDKKSMPQGQKAQTAAAFKLLAGKLPYAVVV